MTLRRVLLLLIFTTLVLASTVTVTAILLNRTAQTIEEAQDRRFSSSLLADELLRSSEMLTRFSRTFVATGDAKYREYYNLILDIRSGKIKRPDDYGPAYWTMVSSGLVPPPQRIEGGKSLIDSLQDEGITIKEFALLQESQIRSDDLVNTEDQAMDLVSDLLASGNANWKAHPDRMKATELLHGGAYQRAKTGILEPVHRFLAMVSERCSKEVRELNEKSDLLLTILISSSILTLLTLIGFSVELHRTLLARGAKLLETMQAITDGDGENNLISGSSDKLKDVSTALDGMTEKLAAAVKSTKQELDASKAITEEISFQKEHSEKLLYSMLPVLIADRLKRGESQIADAFPEVTVLFADIVGFTQLASTMPPRHLVSILNDIFGSFDELSTKYRLEKIKTIGDCYMVVGGVPERSSTHCQQVAAFAIEAVKAIQAYSAQSGLNLNIRIGIHTGTVVAGVVGKTKYSYDLWGDVVNIASRMESASQPNQIHVSKAVQVRLADDYAFDPRGMVELKGKGQFETYFLLNRKEGH